MPQSDIARLHSQAAALTDPQKAALINQLLVTIDDSTCRLAVRVIARNAAFVADELERRAFVARDQKRRVV